VGTEPLIRSSTPDDLAAVVDVFHRASLTNEGDREWILANPDRVAVDERPVLEGKTRVAVIDGQVVGFATLVGAELEDLFVDPDWTRRGIATALVQDAVANGGLERIEVTANGHALAFYERVGFVHDGPAETPGGPAFRMHLDCAYPPP
jgi:GNAT superfamily N-acetyltransferase